jgi:hypothetical protein
LAGILNTGGTGDDEGEVETFDKEEEEKVVTKLLGARLKLGEGMEPLLKMFWSVSGKVQVEWFMLGKKGEAWEVVTRICFWIVSLMVSFSRLVLGEPCCLLVILV